MVGEFHQVDYDRNGPQSGQWEKINFALRRIFSLLDEKSSGPSGGTSDHSQLTNLAYSASGHTGFVPASRTISTTAPLTGGGDLSANRTLSISQGAGSTLDADLLDGNHAAAFAAASHAHATSDVTGLDSTLWTIDAALSDLSGLAGGTTGQILSKTADDDYAFTWVDIDTLAHGLPSGGSAGQVIKKNSATDYDYSWADDSTGAGSEDYADWHKSSIVRNATAVESFGTTSSPNTTGTGGYGVSSIFDNRLPKFYVSSGTTANSKGWYTESADIHKFAPRTRFLFTFFWDAAYANARCYYGMAQRADITNILDSDTPAYQFVAFRLTHGTDTNWQAIVGNGTSTTVVDTGVAADERDVLGEISWDLNMGAVKFYIDRTLVATITTNIPATSTSMSMFMGVKGLTTTSSVLRTSHLTLLQTMKAA